MTCGLGLGILVVFLVQAEHVCCLWTEGAQSFQSSNTYVGLPPPDGSLITSGSHPQNQVRQGFISPLSFQSRSFNTGPAFPSGFGPGLSTRSSTPVSQPAQSSVRLVKSRAFKANRQRLFSPRADAPIGARQSLGLSSVAGGPQNQKNPSIGRNWSALWGTQRPIKYPVLAPRQMFSSRPVPAPRQPSRVAAKMPFSEVGSSSRLFGPDAPGQRGLSALMQTYARGPAKRVLSNRRSEGQKARRFSPHTQAWKPAMGHQGGSRPKSWLQTYKTSHDLAVPRSRTVGAPGQGFSLATVYEIPANFGGFAIRRL
ncbi:uncharacterized protein LOC119428251 [Nematolebias whitei]|uniref:uncharacterized protein LOC119428251 n=1 Tax=Nematolebias whitei TaxID=451745 RepID=UPI001899F010|nr:uncharacterized protein LOC119428251 [Nematolebias whitei]